jgi:hypothetical protein
VSKIALVHTNFHTGRTFTTLVAVNIRAMHCLCFGISCTCIREKIAVVNQCLDQCLGKGTGERQDESSAVSFLLARDKALKSLQFAYRQFFIRNRHHTGNDP